MAIWVTLSLFFFGTMELYVKIFGLHQRVLQSFVLIFCSRMDVKNPSGSPLLPFSALTPFKNLVFDFFRNFSQVSQGFFLQFFHILQQTGISKSPNVTFYKFKNFAFLSLRYSADFGRCQLVYS